MNAQVVLQFLLDFDDNFELEKYINFSSDGGDDFDIKYTTLQK